MDKKISELDQALQINNDAVFPISQDNGGTDTTYKVTITQISAEVGEDQTFSTLDTTDKTLVGAINEIAQGGGGGGSSTLAGLTDVDIDDQTLSDGQVLKYDSAEDKWVNDDVGAGGHTIVADDGTNLAQRAKLQFKGAYSEDNSVDDTTEVNVVRNMTRAQFNQLSADEKTGLINISDESLNATEIPIESGSATNTKSYIDSGLSGKADSSTTYTKSEVDALVPKEFFLTISSSVSDSGISPFSYYGTGTKTDANIHNILAVSVYDAQFNNPSITCFYGASGSTYTFIVYSARSGNVRIRVLYN